MRPLLLGIPLGISCLASLHSDALLGRECAQMLLQIASIASTARGEVGQGFPVRLGDVEYVNHLEPQMCPLDGHQAVRIGSLLPLEDHGRKDGNALLARPYEAVHLAPGLIASDPGRGWAVTPDQHLVTP